MFLKLPTLGTIYDFAPASYKKSPFKSHRLFFIHPSKDYQSIFNYSRVGGRVLLRYFYILTLDHDTMNFYTHVFVKKSFSCYAYGRMIS